MGFDFIYLFMGDVVEKGLVKTVGVSNYNGKSL